MHWETLQTVFAPCKVHDFLSATCKNLLICYFEYWIMFGNTYHGLNMTRSLMINFTYIDMIPSLFPYCTMHFHL